MGFTPLGLTLTLIAALAWVLFDVLRKRLARQVLPSLLGVWLSLGQAPLLLLWALSTGPWLLPKASWGPLLLSVLLNVGGVLWFLQALRSSPLSLTIPLLSFTPVGATLLAWLLRGQMPGPLQWGGISLVASGALLLGIRSGIWPGLHSYLRDPGVRRMAGAALLWSLTAVVDQVALLRGAGYAYAPVLSAGVGLLLGVIHLALGQGKAMAQAARDLRGLPWLGLTALLLGGAALAVQLEALRYAPVGLIETVKRGLGMVGAILFGRLIFKEAITLPKVFAVLLLSAGVALVALGG